MARGYRYALYTTDLGTQFAKLVDADQAVDLARGWDTTTDVTGYPGWPVGAKARRVFGVSPTTGRRNSTIVATVGAPLWAGTVTVFSCETNDAASGNVDLYTVTRRRGESFPAPHP